jgi:general stress protein 26
VGFHALPSTPAHVDPCTELGTEIDHVQGFGDRIAPNSRLVGGKRPILEHRVGEQVRGDHGHLHVCLIQGLTKTPEDGIPLGGFRSVRDEVVIMEVNPVGPQFGQSTDRFDRIQIRPGCRTKGIAPPVPHGPQTKGETMLRFGRIRLPHESLPARGFFIPRSVLNTIIAPVKPPRRGDALCKSGIRVSVRVEEAKRKRRLTMSQMKERIFEIIGRPNLSALATVAEDGKPWVRYVMTTGDGDLSLRFASFLNSRKVTQMKKNPEVHLTCGVTSPETAQHFFNDTATTEIYTDEGERNAYWKEELKRYFSGPDDPNYCVVLVRPYRIEYMSASSPEPEVWEA